MTIFAASALINAISSGILGFIIAGRGINNKVHLTFACFAWSVAVWSLAYFLWQVSVEASEAMFWSQILMACAAFVPFFYFHFTTTFLEIEYQERIIIIVGYIFAASFAAIAFTPLFITGVEPKLIFPFWPNPGPFYLPFLFVWFYYIIYGSYLLLKKFIRSTGVIRSQIAYILTGTLVGYIGGATNFFLWYDIPVLPYGNILVTLYVVMVAYAVLKHRLFNIKVVATELIVVSLWILEFLRLLLSETAEQTFYSSLILFVMIITGFILIRSVNKEVQAKEEIGKLATELAGANIHLEKLDKMKSEFVSMASHQLRSPLTSIRGYVSMILEGSYGEVNPKMREILEHVSDSSRQMALSVEDYLNVSRIEAGGMKYEMDNCDLRKLVEDTVAEMLPVSLKRDMTILFEPKFEGPVVVKLDIGKTKQIIQNLTDNAMKYTPEKGQVTVVLRKDDIGKKVFVDIKDTGIGIAPEALGEIFKKFERAKNANSINVTGTGLGLYIARQMAEAMGGSITVSSEGEGKGSTFTVAFPFSDTKKEPSSPEEVNPVLV